MYQCEGTENASIKGNWSDFKLEQFNIENLAFIEYKLINK